MIINGEEKKIVGKHTLLKLMNDLNLVNQKGIAVAVNNSVIPKIKWDIFNLSENDDVCIIQATQGG